MSKTIDQLIINSPYEPPAPYWRYERESQALQLQDGRRPAGGVIATPDSQAHDDPGSVQEMSVAILLPEQFGKWAWAGLRRLTGDQMRESAA